MDWATLIVGSKITVFALFLLRIWEHFLSTSPREAYIWRSDLTEGFLRYRFEGAYTNVHGFAYFRNFTILMLKIVFTNSNFLLQSCVPVWQWLPVYPLRQLHVKLLMPSTQEPPFWQVWLTQSLISVKLRTGLNFIFFQNLATKFITVIMAVVWTAPSKSNGIK